MRTVTIRRVAIETLFRACTAWCALCLLGGAGLSPAQDPGDPALTCTVRGDTVVISWSASSTDPALGLQGELQRDGQVIAQIAPGDVSYTDTNVPPGEHRYTLISVQADGIALIRECTVFVGDNTSPVRCEVDGNTVTITWTVPADILALGFTISRDGELVATLGADARSYRDEAAPGAHTYIVSTDNRLDDPNVPPGGAPDFLIGSCEVKVGDGFGIQCRVRESTVTIDWQPLPIDVAIQGYVVRRNGETVARLPADALTYRESVEPGVYAYEVAALPWSDDPDNASQEIVVGTCRVSVGGDPGLPPPEGLQCAIAESFPVQVQLFWTNPVRYSSIVVLRDGQRVALLEGDATRFSEVDPGAGRHLYAVLGTAADGQMSPPATCTVFLEGPPQGNHLSLVPYPRSNADDNTDPAGVAASTDSLVAVLRNSDPVQAWSFGMCSDASVLTVGEATVEGTSTADLNDGDGPTFLAINVTGEGVSMGAVIDERDPVDVLPPGLSSDLLIVRYEPGPDAERGEPYPVRFCGTLGDPPVAILVVTGGFEKVPGTSPGVVMFSSRPFLRADADQSGEVDLTDGVYVLEWLFRSGSRPRCLDAADANGSGDTNIADAVYIFQSLFAGGPPPPAPYPECGSVRPTLGCEESVCEQ